MKVENKTLIITDPCYVQQGKALESRSTICGDWKCSVFKFANKEDVDYVIHHDDNLPKPQKVLGTFTADSGEVGIFINDKSLVLERGLPKYCYCVIPEFTGDVSIQEVDRQVYVVGYGNIIFCSIRKDE